MPYVDIELLTFTLQFSNLVPNTYAIYVCSAWIF